jgi:PadR family transcriptional regulator PadR
MQTRIAVEQEHEKRNWRPMIGSCPKAKILLLTSNRKQASLVWLSNGSPMGDRNDVWQGTLALMVLRTLEVLGPLHGYGIARRIEQTSGDLLSVNYGTLYPALLKLEQEGYISSEWGVSENNRKAKFYKLTRAGRQQVVREAREWEQTTAILAKFLAAPEEST